MKTQLLTYLTVVILFLMASVNFGQAPDLGTSAGFVLFSTNGAVSNMGISQLTGNVGTNNGSSTAFGNVNGVMHDGDGASAQCATDLLLAYNQLNSTTADFFPASLLGNGDTLVAGVYSISEAATLNLDLFLDAEGDPDAVFIFQIDGSFSTNANSKIKLINGGLACNVFWKVEGMVSMATGTTMRGTIIANNAEIYINTGDTLEGRAFSTAGAVTVDGVLAYTPIGCGSPYLDGPTAPVLGAAACYGIFSSDGAVTNTGETYITGDVGSNNGAVTGFDPLNVLGDIHLLPDGSTEQCAADLLIAYNYVNVLPYDIELLYPAQFGRNLVLTPHTYLMGGAATFTDTLFLNAQGNSDAVFIIKINGALSTSVYSKVNLINGAQAKNVYWKIEGAVNINNYSVFCGTIICNNGALGALNTGVTLNGRALTTTGALTTTEVNAVAPMIPANCGTINVSSFDTEKEVVAIYPNPFSTYTTITINDFSQIEKADPTTIGLRIYNAWGEEVINTIVTKQFTTLETSNLPSGIYFYNVISKNIIIQSGKLVSQ
ncbi:MAG: ice-binding family protein [Bacteroidota bacterium]